MTPEATLARNATVEANLWLVKFFVRGRLASERGWVDRDDLIQEGMLGLLRAVELYDPAKGMLSHYAGLWIRDRANKAAAYSRGPLHVPWCNRGEPLPSSGPDALPFVAAREDGGFPDREALDALWAAVDALREPDRTVIRLRYGEGLLLREIGERLDRTTERIRQLEARAVRRLREMLGEDRP